MGKGQPRTKGVPSPVERIPRAIANLASDDGSPKYPIISFALADHVYSGEWGWELLGGDASKRLLKFLCGLSRSTWNELLNQTVFQGHKKHHAHPIADLCSKAQRRLEELKYDDIATDLFRFRDGSTFRLWGFKVGGIFYAVWCDPDHKVYPTDPSG